MNIKRNNNTILYINPSSNSQLDDGVMSDHKLSLSWSQSAYTSLEIGDYIELWGEQYKLNQLPTVKKISSIRFDYDCEFQSSAYDLSKAAYMLFDNTATLPQAEFPLTGNARTFVTLLVANLNRVAGSEQWFVGDVLDTVYKTLEFANDNCMDVLSRLATEFETEYRISANTVHLTKVTRTNPIVLEYGSTLYNLERINTNNSNIITRLYAFGAERNIASDYRGGAKRLMLPASQFIEANTAVYGVIEATKTFDSIYPRLAAGVGGQLAGQITATDPTNTLKFTDSNLDFNVNEHLIAGTPAKVAFIDGALGGYEFEIKLFVNSTKTFTLIENTDEKDFSLPNTSLKPSVGDKYVLLYINMPQAYVDRAEAELQAAATEYLNKNKSPQTTYRCTFSDIYAAVNNPDFRVGDMVTVVDTQLGINEEIRIIKLTRNIVEPWRWSIDLANTVTPSTLERITSDIKSTATETITQRRDIRQTYVSAYRNLKELQDTVFDTDGYFDPVNIRPLSITTNMLSVGSKSQQFQLTCTFQPNADAQASKFRWSAGSLFHFSISDTGVTTWNISSGVISGLTAADYPSYIYAKCSKTTDKGEILLSPEQFKLEDVADYYMFLLGVLHTPVDGVCGISLNYGQTTINGQFIRTGVISSIDNAVYFDLNSGQIVAGPNRLNADGSISFGNGNFTISTDGDCSVKGTIEALAGKIGGLTIHNSSLSSESMEFAESAVESISDLISPNYVSISRQESWTGGDTAETQSITVNFSAILRFRISVDTYNTSYGSFYWELIDDDGRIVDEGSGQTTATSQSAVISIPMAGLEGTPVRIKAYHGNPDPYSQIDIAGYDNVDIIKAEYFIMKTKIGNNGFFSFWDAYKYFYFSESSGLKMRGPVDVPGIPSTIAYIGWAGGITRQTGRVQITCTKTGTGYYSIHHNLGKSAIYAIVTPVTASTNVVLKIHQITSTLIDVFSRNIDSSVGVDVDFVISIYDAI